MKNHVVYPSLNLIILFDGMMCFGHLSQF